MIESYYDPSLAGVEVTIIKDKILTDNSVLIGFPLDSNLGWYDSAYVTEYRCWWIEQEYLENVTTITKSKFK